MAEAKCVHIKIFKYMSTRLYIYLSKEGERERRGTERIRPINVKTEADGLKLSGEGEDEI